MTHSFAFRFRLWRIRWGHWEYWPFWAAVIPVVVNWLWFALLSRRWYFFGAANPALTLGGAFGVSKSGILDRLPPDLLPLTLTLDAGITAAHALEKISAAGLRFPFVVKPDVGERGFGVKKIDTPEQLALHLAEYPVKLIVQEFLTQPLEMTVFFYRMPGENGRFVIPSVCRKEFLHVTGDGRSTVLALMLTDDRAALQIPRFEREKPDLLRLAPARGERLLLEPIGNHNRGTKFVDARHLIADDLVAVFEPLCRRLEGVYYGRFDLKCDSVDALRRGEFKIMELNGIFSDPTHVFDPSFGMWRAFREYGRYWRIIYRISRENMRRGIPATSWREARACLREYRAATRDRLKYGG